MSLLFDAVGEYVQIADNPKWNFTPVVNMWTFSLWWRSSSLPNVDGEYQLFFQLNDDSGNKFHLSITRTSGINLLIAQVLDNSWSNLGAFYVASPSLSIDIWSHFVFVASSNGNCKIYIDKVSQTVGHSSWDDSTAIEPDFIYLNSVSSIVSDNFQLAHFAVFSDELTSDEVTNLYNDPYCMDSDANIICSIHKDEEIGSIANDVQTVVAQTDGIITGATWTYMPRYFKKVSDSGAGADALSLLNKFSIADSGLGADIAAMLNRLIVAETGVGADVLMILAKLVLADTGAGVDAVSIISTIIQILINDAGIGSDELAILVRLLIEETASGNDLLSILVKAALSDSGSGMDEVSKSEGIIHILIPDMGEAEEAISIFNHLRIEDSGSGIDQVLIKALVSVLDEGAGVDVVNIFMALIKIISSLFGFIRDEVNDGFYRPYLRLEFSHEAINEGFTDII